MSKSVNFALVALAALLFCAYIEARATPSITHLDDIITSYNTSSGNIVSYIDDLNLSYNATDDIWQCDMVRCPTTTRRCVIKRYNKPNELHLTRVNECYNRFNMKLFTLQYNQLFPVNGTKIEIEINSFLGAETEVFYGYSNSSQFVNGSTSVAWQDWKGIQQQMRNVISEVQEYNLKIEKKFVCKNCDFK